VHVTFTRLYIFEHKFHYVEDVNTVGLFWRHHDSRVAQVGSGQYFASNSAVGSEIWRVDSKKMEPVGHFCDVPVSSHSAARVYTSTR